MNVNKDLLKIRRDMYKMYSQDGLWDILFGWYLFIWQGTLLSSSPSQWFPGPSFAVVFLVVWLLRRRVTYRRTGRARLPETERRLRFWTVFGVTLVLSELFSLLYTGRLGHVSQGYAVLAFGVTTAVILGLIAFWWKVDRFYGWALMVVATFAIYPWLATHPSFIFIIPGGIMEVYGAVLLYRFIHRYPRPSQEVEVGGNAIER